MPDSATPPVASDPNLKLAPIDVPDASATQAELDAKISEELNIPKATPTPPEDNPDNPPKPAEEENPPAPADEEEVPPVEEEEVPPAPAEEEEQPPEPVPSKPSEPATPSDEDLFVEVLDAEGVTHKISSIDDLPEDFAPKNNRQILEIIKATDRLDAEREQRAQDTAKAEQDALIQETQTEQFKSWDAEIAELVKTDDNLKDSVYVNNVFGYMNELNAARQKAGNPNLISSFEDALFRFQAKEAADKIEKDKVNDNQRAKQKTALIGRSSASAGGDNYVYRAGSARSIDDIPID